jgi:hypothetical protein
MGADFNLVAGATGILDVQIVDTNGDPVDISACTEITFKAKHNALAATPLDLNLSKTGGEITFLTDGKDGAFEINISDTLTAALDTHYWYNFDCKISFSPITYDVQLDFTSDAQPQNIFGVLVGVS